MRAQNLPGLALKLFLALAAALVAANVFVWFFFSEPAPYADMVDVEWFLGRWSLARDGLGPLVAYNDNEHRSLLPLLLQALDRSAFASTGSFLVAAHIACLAVVAAAFARHAAFALPATALGRAGVVATALVFLWSAHWHNVVWTKTTQIGMAAASVALAFWLIARLDAQRTQRPWLHMAAASALLVNAAWSFAVGVVAPVAALGFMIVRPWSWPRRLAMAAVAVFAATSQFFASGGLDGGAATPAPSPVAVVLYGLNFLGGASRAALGGDEIVPPVLAAIALGLSGALLLLALSPKGGQGVALEGTRAQAASFFILMLLWMGPSAAGVAWIRAHFGVDQAFAPRYAIFSAMFLTSAVLLVASLRSVLPGLVATSVRWVSIVFVAAIVLTHPRGWGMTIEDHQRVTIGAVAAALGVDDLELGLHPTQGARTLELTEDYRARNAAFFRRPWAQWLRAEAGAVFPDSWSSPCEGVVGSVVVAPVGGGAYRVSAGLDGRTTAWVAIVDDDGRIAGLARKGHRFRAEPAAWSGEADAVYAGFARLDGQGRVRALAVSRGGGRACDLGAAAIDD